MSKKSINILYCIDEDKKDYSRHLWVSLCSLCENNKKYNLNIYIITTKLDKDNEKELIRIVNEYWQFINIFNWKRKDFIPNDIWKLILKNHNNTWSVSTWYRLFFLNAFPNLSDRILYLDCDTIINWDISEFYFADFCWAIVRWCNNWILVQNYDKYHDLQINEYINAWVVLFNIQPFSKISLSSIFEDCLKKWITLKSNDQDFINYAFKNKISIVDNKYNYLIYNITYYIKYKLDDLVIIHTLTRPYWFTRCPRKIKQLYHNYLLETKRWKQYWTDKITLKQICKNIYSYIFDTIGYLLLKIFGINCYLKYNNCIYNFWQKFFKRK